MVPDEQETELKTDGEVLLRKEGSIATIVFSRPSVRNAMTWPMYEQLQSACQSLRDDRSIRVVVLRGDGGEAFVAGTDISTFSDFTGVDDGAAYEERMEGVFNDLESLPQPTIAAVEGFATGGGLLLSAICDVRLVTPSARFGMPIARTLGNCLSMRNYARLVSVLGASRVAAMVMTATFMTGDEAAAAGFAFAVHRPDELDREVIALAESISRHAPLTMWATKEALRRLRFEGLPEGGDLVRVVVGSEDFRSGVQAFVDKRPAEWMWR